jgi:hypothetical protein
MPDSCLAYSSTLKMEVVTCFSKMLVDIQQTTQHYIPEDRTLHNHCYVNLKCYIFPVLLYGCETWFHTLRGEHKLRVSENRVLRRIFGFKRNEKIGGWRKLHNEELHNLYSSPNNIIMIKRRM